MCNSMFEERFMRKAVDLALKVSPFPNPRVGAVLVLNGEIVAFGWHCFFGGKHAEVLAIEEGVANGVDVSLCDLYVTLEPCCHVGKQGSCVDVILSSGIRTVYIGVHDEHDIVGGKGIALLKESGIDVSVGYLQNEIKAMNKRYYDFLSSDLPFVILKNGVSANGKITTKDIPVSCEESLLKGQHLRGWVDAILVGVNTVLADDPFLTCRFGGGNPVRVILDTHLRTPLDAHVFDDDNVIVCCSDDVDTSKLDLIRSKVKDVILCPLMDGLVDLCFVLKELRTRGLKVLLVEGGQKLNTSFFAAGLVDKYILITSPVTLENEDAVLDVFDGAVMNLEKLRDFECIVYESVGVDTWEEFLCK